MLNVFRKNLITLLLFASVLLMAGCELDTKEYPEPEHLVTVNLTGLQPASLLKSTASAEEKAISKVVYFGVDANGDYVDKYPIDGAPSASQSLTISKRITTLYAVANPSTDIANATPSATDWQNMTVSFTIKPVVGSFLMSGSGSISNGSVNIALVRSVAKIEINGKKGFKVTEVTVTSTSSSGYVFQRSPLSVPAGNTSYAATSDTVLYVAENTSGNTKLTVKGTYDNKTGTKAITLDLDIARNKHYSISVSPGSAGTQYGVDVKDWYDATVTQSETVQNPYKNGIKILAIGNSYSQCGMQYLYDLLTQAGVAASGIKLTCAYIGGSPLHVHWWSLIDNEQDDPNYFGVMIPANRYSPVKFYANGVAEYDYYDPASNSYRYWTLTELVQSDNWDIITLQQSSDYSGRPEIYDPYLGNLLNYVKSIKTNPKCKFAWHMTWTWGGGASFGVYGNQTGMYNAICSTVQTKIVPRLKLGGSDFDFIIPSGIAIQNARAADPVGFGDNLNTLYDTMVTPPQADNSHLTAMGCYIAGVAWVKAITGNNLANLTKPYHAAAPNEGHYGPAKDINATEITKAVNAVNAAYATISAAPYLNP